MDEIETLTLRQAESLVEYLYKDELRCPRVGKFDALPKSTAIIDKLSQLGDQQVRAMRADELESFLSEVLGLIETEFAEGEIRDDTKASFAAWKIRKASNDARYRQLPVRESVTVTLRRNFMKYPYKMSLVNCYLIHLLEVPYEHEIGNFFSMMLQSAKKTDYVDQPGFYGGFIRTQIMFSLADNWNLVAEESRSALREMIFKEVCAWYADGEQPTWHEHYAVYWLFVNAGIDQEINLPLSEFDFVNRVRQLFLLMNHGQAAGNDPVLVAQMGTVWRRNRPRNASKQMSKSEFEWIAWVWRKIAGPPNVWKWKLEGHGRVWCELAWGRELCLTGYGFRRLMELTDQHLIKFFNGEDLQLGGATSEVIPIYNGLIEILNQTVSLYMENSDASFMKKFDQALKLMPEGARIRTYLVRRLANLKTITELFFPEDQQMKHFPSFVKGQAVDCIPLQDWLEVVSVAPRSFETSRIHKALLPLTETEITILAIEFIKKILKDNPQYDQPLSEIFLTIDNEWSKASLNRIGFSVESWIGWRNGEATAKVEILDNFVIFSEYYLSAWAYTTPFIFDRQYLICFSLAMLILRLISNKHDKFGAAGIMQLRGWSNISTIVSQAEFPSTVLAEIIAGFVNYQKPFYDQLAEQLDEELPLLPLEKEPIWTLREFLDRLDDHLTRLQTRFFIGDTGLREMRFIDIDKLVKE